MTLLSSSSSSGPTLRVWMIVLRLSKLIYRRFRSITRPRHDHTIITSLPAASPAYCCVIQHCHCSSCAQHSAPTAAAGRVLCACRRCALYSQYWCSLLLSSALAYARTFRNVWPAFFVRYRSSPDRYVRRLEYNKNKSFARKTNRPHKHHVQQRSYKTHLQWLLTAGCPTLLTDRS